ncbi:MAG: class I SAM-dependent methyltransferase [Hyphomonadaceae bacterium]
MRKLLVGLGVALVVGACAGGAVPGLMTAPAERVTTTSAHVLAALADPRRPAADRERDVLRHPAEVLAFAGVQPGWRVADVGPGGGYYTRLFAVAVGDGGRVYGVNRVRNPAATQLPAILAVAEQYPNITVIEQGYQGWTAPEPLDAIFISQIYHDFHLPAAPPRPATDTQAAFPGRQALDVPAINRGMFAALKPGGVLVVIDHAAVEGSELTVADTLHRIEQSDVRSELEAAGFIFEEESQALRNPADNRSIRVFEGDIRGRTDQFVMRFRKPAN